MAGITDEEVNQVPDKRGSTSSAQSLPRYMQIVESLRNDIEQGRYREGDLLPSEADLRAIFAVSRHTIREALRSLRDEGYLESRQGAATRITLPSKPLYTYSVSDVAELLQYATDARYEIDKTSIVTADAALAAQLSCAEGSRWLRIEGFRYPKGDERPLCWTQVYILSEYSGVAVMIGRQAGTIYSFIEDMYGVRVEQVNQLLYTAIMPAGALAGNEPDPSELAIVIRRTYRLEDKNVPLIAMNYHFASRLSLNWTLKRSAPM